MYQAQDISWPFYLSIDKTITAGFSLLCKRTEYISRDTDATKRKKRVHSRDSPYPPFVLLHALPREEQGRQDGAWKRRRKRAGRGKIHRRAPDLHLGRHASWNSHSGKKLFYHTSSRRARFSARCCFAFYTGVEIWSLDAPMHQRSGPPLTGRTRPPPTGTKRYEPPRSSWMEFSNELTFLLLNFCI